MNDQAIEQQIQAKGLTAPRITPASMPQSLARLLPCCQVWELEGYLLQQRLHEQSNDFPLGKACDLSGEGTCEACQ